MPSASAAIYVTLPRPVCRARVRGARVDPEILGKRRGRQLNRLLVVIQIGTSNFAAHLMPSSLM